MLVATFGSARQARTLTAAAGGSLRISAKLGNNRAFSALGVRGDRSLGPRMGEPVLPKRAARRGGRPRQCAAAVTVATGSRVIGRFDAGGARNGAAFLACCLHAFGLVLLAAGPSGELAGFWDDLWRCKLPLFDMFPDAVPMVAMAAAIPPPKPGHSKMDEVSSPQQLRQANERLRREVAAHEATLRELEAVRRELEARVTERTKELSLVKARLETALRGAKVYVFSQDRDLRYTWAYTPRGAETGNELIGRTDEELLPAAERDAVIALKRSVLRSGEPADCEISYLLPQGRTLVALHIDPTYGADGSIDGIMCAATDISRTRSLESEQRRLAQELGAALQRYETALRGSNVTVFTQDKALRYTSISNAFLGREVDAIVGHADEEVLPPANADVIMALKREALASGEALDKEVHIHDGSADSWFDFHIEPLRDPTGQIVGLTCAAVDITERKEGEAHLRLLMRELTHRSKNLLAVIQAMARQTARHTGTVESFLEQFGARLQALATSHDLLVQESWYGASLNELVRLQLGHHLDRSQVTVQGPPILLKPEAAQGLGLALHELATNAAKYGSLSRPSGRVSIDWRRMPASEGHGVEITWQEKSGPEVAMPEQRGFGTLVIERNLVRTLDAQVELLFASDGVCCRIIIPVTQFVGGR
jgi:PAS domain S-box-containing protein